MTDHSTEREGLIARLNESADDINNVKMPRHSAYLLLREAAAALAEPCPGPHLVPVDESAEDAWYALAEPVVEPTSVRCPSCEHLPSFHSEGGCWFSVTNAEPLRDVVCPCAAEPGPSPAEPTEVKRNANYLNVTAEVQVEPTPAPTCDRPGAAHKLRNGRMEHWHGRPYSGKWEPPWEPCPAETARVTQNSGLTSAGPTEAQVEAAAKVYYECDSDSTSAPWEGASDWDRRCYRKDARAALTAALEVKPESSNRFLNPTTGTFGPVSATHRDESTGGQA